MVWRGGQTPRLNWDRVSGRKRRGLGAASGIFPFHLSAHSHQPQGSAREPIPSPWSPKVSTPDRAPAALACCGLRGRAWAPTQSKEDFE